MNGKLLSAVIDNGIGISEAVLPRVCAMFFRGTEASQGAGLGLYIVQEIVRPPWWQPARGIGLWQGNYGYDFICLTCAWIIPRLNRILFLMRRAETTDEDFFASQTIIRPEKAVLVLKF